METILERLNKALDLVTISEQDKEFLKGVLRSEVGAAYYKGSNDTYEKINNSLYTKL